MFSYLAKNFSEKVYHIPRSSKIQSFTNSPKYLITFILTTFVTLRQHPPTTQVFLITLMEHQSPKVTLGSNMSYHLFRENFIVFNFYHLLFQIIIHCHKFLIAISCSSKFMEPTKTFFFFKINCGSCFLTFIFCSSFCRALQQTKLKISLLKLKLRFFLQRESNPIQHFCINLKYFQTDTCDSKSCEQNVLNYEPSDPVVILFSIVI